MLDEYTLLNAHNICGNPIHRSPEIAESSVHDHKVSLSHDHSRLVLQRWRDAFDQIEQTFTTRRDMSAVLDVVRGPESLRCCILAFVEKGVESLKDQCLVLLLEFSGHFLFPPVHWNKSASSELLRAHTCPISDSRARRETFPPKLMVRLPSYAEGINESWTLVRRSFRHPR